MGFDAETHSPLNGPVSSSLKPLYSLMEAGLSGPPRSTDRSGRVLQAISRSWTLCEMSPKTCNLKSSSKMNYNKSWKFIEIITHSSLASSSIYVPILQARWTSKHTPSDASSINSIISSSKVSWRSNCKGDKSICNSLHITHGPEPGWPGSLCLWPYTLSTFYVFPNWGWILAWFCWYVTQENFTDPNPIFISTCLMLWCNVISHWLGAYTKWSHRVTYELNNSRGEGEMQKNAPRYTMGSCTALTSYSFSKTWFWACSASSAASSNIARSSSGEAIASWTAT